MNLTKLMELFANPDTIHTLSFGSKCTASFITTIMGMGITFTALVLLLFVIGGMHKVLTPQVAKKGAFSDPQGSTVSITPSTQSEDNEEEIAAVMAAVFLAIEPGRNEVVIKNIRRVNDFHPRWSQEGLREQHGNKL